MIDPFSSLRADLQGNNPVVDPPGGYDCLVVGAGPAGLAAGRYLGRYGRSVLVVDGGNQRASLIPTSHNYPGFKGMHGTDLLAAMRSEAREYGAVVEPGWVTSIKKIITPDSDYNPPLFEATLNARTVRARTVILATGVKNTKPVGVDDDVHTAAIAAKMIRYCPICDAFEARGKKIVSIGSSAHGVSEVLFIYRYSTDITIMPDTSPGLTDEELVLMRDLGVTVLDSPLVSTTLVDDKIVARDASGVDHPFDIMYPSLGSHCYTELAVQLGCSLAPDGEILTDPHFATTVAGVWAAGDVVEGLDQVVVAEAQAAVTATAVHNSFRPTELKLLGELPIPNKNSANHPWSSGKPNGTVDLRRAALATNLVSAAPTTAPRANPKLVTAPAAKPMTRAAPLLRPVDIPKPTTPPHPAVPATVPKPPAMTHPSVPRPMSPHLPLPPKPLKPVVAKPVSAPHAPKPPRPAVL